MKKYITHLFAAIVGGFITYVVFNEIELREFHPEVSPTIKRSKR